MTDYEREIVELHQFFEDWFTGRLANTDAVFARFADSMAPDFHLVNPSGRLTARPALITGLRGAYNTWDEGRIWIENVEFRGTYDAISIVTYEEWQAIGEAEGGRLSTVMFKAAASTANGLLWLHVHETWLPE